MASSRKPGSLCLTHGALGIDDGTLSLTCSPTPGTLWQTYLQTEAMAMFARQEAMEAIKRLFDSCLNPEVSLSAADFQAAADKLDVEVELIRAVASVESPRGPFDENGHPTILFERHYFHHLTQGKYDQTHPAISHAVAGGYGKFRAQYGKLEEAYNLDPSAALQSASWGKFQIMGRNYQAAGFASVEDLVAAMMKSEKNQLEAFVSFVKSDSKLLGALKKKSWADFARGYNGAGYAKNEYDTKLKTAYENEVRNKTRTANPIPNSVARTK